MAVAPLPCITLPGSAPRLSALWGLERRSMGSPRPGWAIAMPQAACRKARARHFMSGWMRVPNCSMPIR